MNIPSRIQLRRTKGWKMPQNTVKVARPSKWGNPFSVAEFGRREALFLYAQYLDDQISLGTLHLEELRGKNLACWCGQYEQCHADILLKKSNT